MNRAGTRRHSARRLAALGIVGAFALAGCAEGGSEGGGASAGGPGVPAGAPMADYQAALAGIPPIVIRTQTPAPAGSPTGLPMERYFAAVSEWSGGTVTFDVQYSNAVASVSEVDDALVDGRLDFGSVLPIYEPSDYPANAALVDGGVMADQSAVQGVLSSNAWPNQVAFETPEVMAEFEDNGMVAVLPVYNSGANALFCSTPHTDLATMQGASVAAGGQAQNAAVSALGGVASSIPYTELFEALQRGVADCTVSSPTVAVLGGFVEQAPHAVIDPAAGFALAPGALAFSAGAWESYPLAVQQLLWDRLDVFIESNVNDKIFPNNAEMVAATRGAGGGVTPFADDARGALQAENQRLLEGLRTAGAVADGPAFVDAMQAANQQWNERVAALGYPDVSYQDFDAFMAGTRPDLGAWTEAVMADVFAAHRPS